ncbi:hypothetical protein MAR_035186 [Mya arenaria]|uniref:VWFA domain-containing protein n=1 Tax=Mya arenaria TaxID=6604 RepID=A0ABY7EJR7_MYAAR|nr:hypothetical protein MAR_035186 [Mya arenaria]
MGTVVGGRRIWIKIKKGQSCGLNCQATNLLSNFTAPSGLGSTGYGQLRDLLIILDSSGSIGQNNFDNAKAQLSRLVGMFCPYPGMRFRADVKQAVLLITDGMSNFPNETFKEALELQKHATVYGLAIGVSSQAGRNEITNCASSPPSRHLFSIPGFDDLETLVDDIQHAQCARFH